MNHSFDVWKAYQWLVNDDVYKEDRRCQVSFLIQVVSHRIGKSKVFPIRKLVPACTITGTIGQDSARFLTCKSMFPGTFGCFIQMLYKS